MGYLINILQNFISILLLIDLCLPFKSGAQGFLYLESIYFPLFDSECCFKLYSPGEGYPKLIFLKNRDDDENEIALRDRVLGKG